MKLELHAEAPDDRLRNAPVVEQVELWIGRDPACSLVLPSTLVSRRHAWLEQHGAELTLHDSSANGSFVDACCVHNSSAKVSLASRIRIGPYTLRLVASDEPRGEAPQAAEPSPEPNGARVTIALRKQIHQRLLEHADLVQLSRGDMDASSLRPRVLGALKSICTELGDALARTGDLDTLIAELCDEALGLGPLETLLRDPRVTEIMVIDAQTIFAETDGKLTRSAQHFTDESAVRAVIERIVTPLGRRIDESAPMVDARLSDGSRVNAIIPPLARKGSCLTIRKFCGAPLALSDLIRLGSLDARMARFLTRAVQARRNLVVSGGTGSGKTTLLNVLSASIPEHERIVTIEDAAELRLQQCHVVALEARPANLEGNGEVNIRELVRNALRMRPDRIIVGECRGGEALDMLQAMNTGHEGSMTTTHANSPPEAVARLETLCLMSEVELPLRAIRAQLAASIQLIVQQARFADGSRRITCVSELVGVTSQGDVALADVFRFENGEFRATGYVPRCVEVFIERGLIDDGQYL